VTVQNTQANSLLNSAGIKRLFWFIPILLAFHNIEEAVTMPHWMSVHLPTLKEKIWLFEYLNFSTKQLYISLILVTLLPLLLSYSCLKGEVSEQKKFLLLILQSIVFWNALMPHVSGVFVLGMYNPGVVTAVVCNIPFSIYLFRKIQKERIVTNNLLRKSIFIGFTAYLPLVYLNHFIAQTISKMF